MAQEVSALLWTEGWPEADRSCARGRETVVWAAFRRCAFNLLKACSIGLSSHSPDNVLWRAERLRHDPAMRWIVGGKAAQGCAASPSQIGRFEIQWLAAPKSLSLLPICPASGLTLCTVAARREASCSTWIRA
jgi:hypothetical protein